MISGFAYFENRADGTSAKLEIGRFTNNRHTALDTDVVIHEFVHGVTSRVIGGKNMHSPLPHQQ
jgi:extracellular elastinolytic metalloproteinase